MLYRLIPGFVVIPISYWIYTIFSFPRFRCHVPSWSMGNYHFIFELVPYIFIICSFVLLFSTARYALLHSSELITNIVTLGLAFQFSVFSFAVSYYQFGLLVKPDLHEYIASLLFFMRDTGATANIEEMRSILLDERIGVAISLEASGIAARYPISTDIWDYVLFSLSAPLSDDKITGVALCPHATGMRILQDFSNLAFGLLSVIILVRFEPQQKSGAEERQELGDD